MVILTQARRDQALTAFAETARAFRKRAVRFEEHSGAFRDRHSVRIQGQAKNTLLGRQLRVSDFIGGMRMRRIKVCGRDAVYHVMTRTVNGERLFQDREKEVLRKMIWQVADFSGVEVLTYGIMSNHFHLLVRVRYDSVVSDAELIRRHEVLYPQSTQSQAESTKVIRSLLSAGGDEAERLRRSLQARMHDLSEFMKTLKQRFSIWYNRSHQRFGTLWAERFKSVLVQLKGNALQAVAAYIDLNPVRAGLVQDPKDYRFCGYAQAVAGCPLARQGLLQVWMDQSGTVSAALKAHRMLIFGKGASPWTHHGRVIDRQKALVVLNEEHGQLPKAVMLRCRIRYFTDGAILGSAEFVRGFAWDPQIGNARRFPPRVSSLKGDEWGGLCVLRELRGQVFG